MTTTADTSTAKPRITYIDTMKGICIILVVIYHCCPKLFTLIDPGLNHYLQQFRIPMYYFLSGLFFKTYGSFVEFLKRKVNNLIVPFFFFLALAAVIFMLWDWRCHTTFDTQLLYKWLYTDDIWLNGPLWFLMSLFWTNILYWVVVKVTRNAWQEWALIAAFAAVGFLLARHGIWPILWSGCALVSLPFFAMGALCNRLEVLKASRWDKWGWAVFILVSAAIYRHAGYIDIRSLELPAFWKFYLLPSAAILSLLWLVKNIKSPVPIVTYLGRYSIIVLVTHKVLSDFRFVYEHILLTDGKMGVVGTLVFIIVIELCLIPFFVRFFPHVTAQKPLIPIGQVPKSEGVM